MIIFRSMDLFGTGIAASCARVGLKEGTTSIYASWWTEEKDKGVRNCEEENEDDGLLKCRKIFGRERERHWRTKYEDRFSDYSSLFCSSKVQIFSITMWRIEISRQEKTDGWIRNTTFLSCIAYHTRGKYQKKKERKRQRERKTLDVSGFLPLAVLSHSVRNSFGHLRLRISWTVSYDELYIPWREQTTEKMMGYGRE